MSVIIVCTSTKELQIQEPSLPPVTNRVFVSRPRNLLNMKNVKTR